MIWMMLPMMKMITPNDMDRRRPHQSAVLRVNGNCAYKGEHSLGTRKRTNERTDTHQTDHCALNDRDPFRLARLGVCAGREAIDKVPEEQHGGDLPRVIPEEKASDRGDRAEEDRFDTAVGAVDTDGSGVSGVRVPGGAGRRSNAKWVI